MPDNRKDDSVAENDTEVLQALVKVHGHDYLIGLDWSAFFESSAALNLKLSSPKTSEYGIIYLNEVGLQSCESLKKYNGSISLATTIALSIRKLYETSSEFIFCTKLGESDDIWFIVVDDNGTINSISDKYIHIDEFLEVVDDLTLVSDLSDKITIYHNDLNLSQINLEDANIKKVSLEELLSTNTKLLSVKKTRPHRILGMALPIFSISALLLILILTYGIGSYLSTGFISQVLSPNYSIKNLKQVPPRQKQPKVWQNLDIVYKNNFSLLSIDDIFHRLIYLIPNNIPDWTTSELNLNGDKFNFSISLQTNKTHGIEFALKEQDTFMKEITNSFTGEWKSAISKSMDTIKHSTNVILKEDTFGFDNYSKFKNYFKPSQDKKRKAKLHRVYSDYKTLKATSQSIRNKYTSAGPFMHIFYALTGTLHSDISVLSSNAGAARLVIANYKEASKELTFRAPPSTAFSDSVMPKNSRNKIFNFAQLNADFGIQSPTTYNKSINVYSFSLVGISKPNIKKLLHPLEDFKYRLTSLQYNWKSSEWTITGEIYEAI